MDAVTLHRRTVADFVDRVSKVSQSQWADPTPCTEWSVRDLVNHVVGEDRWTVPLLAGQTIADVGHALDGDLLGDDPLAAATEAGERACVASAERAPEGGTVHLSYGEESVEEYLAQLSSDHLIHGWDLAAATGSDTRFDPEVVDAVAAWFADREDLLRSFGLIAARVPVDSADTQTRLLASFGRDPEWSPRAASS